MANLNAVMATMTMHIIPVLENQDQKRCNYRYLRKPKTMKVCIFTARIIQQNNYLPYFPPDCVGYMVIALPGDEVKEILNYTIQNTWRKKMTKQGHYYLDRSIQDMSGFFETRIENLKTPASLPAVKKLPEKKKRETLRNRNP